MFASLSIRWRLCIVFSIILVASSLFLVWFKTQELTEVVAQSERRELVSFAQQLQGKIAAEERLALALADFVARLPDVQEYLAEDNRSGLQNTLQEAFAYLKSEHGLRQFQFHAPPAQSWLRVHKAEKFGDDLSAFRSTVVATNTRLEPVSGVEAGVAGLGIRGVVPMRVNGQHWGSVEFGFSLGQPFFDAFKASTGLDVNLYRTTPSGDIERFAGTLGSASLLQAAQYTAAMQGAEIIDVVELRGRSGTILLEPLLDYSGEAIGVFELVLDRSEYAALVHDSILGSLVLVGIALLVGLGITFLVTLGITRPITAMRLAMEDIAAGEGDLTRRLPEVGGRELRLMAASFNAFVARIEGLLNQSIAAIAEVSVAGGQLFSESHHTRETIDQQKSKTDDVAAAVNEMTTTASVVAANAEEAAGKCAQSRDRSDQGFSELKASIESINDVASDVSSAVTLISDVSAQSGKISGILDVIRAIAEQTNLLALNAAIEAARAGDQGRGFAVVADEVRSLAARTQNSTTEINDMISHLQEGIQKAVDCIELSRTRAERTVTQAQRSGDALQEIHQMVESINDSMLQIASTAEEQSQVTEGINQSIHDIADGAQEVSQQSGGIMAASSRVGEELAILLKLVNAFKTQRDTGTELAIARAAHISWKMRLRKFLDGEGGLDSSQAKSHRECDFGLWFYHPEQSQLRQDPDLQAIEQPHERMHSLIGEIIQNRSNGNLAAAEAAYEQVCQLSDQIVAGLDRAARRAA